jgi:hypothetical protein
MEQPLKIDLAKLDLSTTRFEPADVEQAFDQSRQPVRLLLDGQ